MIPVYRPYITPKCIEYVNEALYDTEISWHGKFIKKCQEKISEITGFKYCLLTSSGTTAIHLALETVKRYNDIYDIAMPNGCYASIYNMTKLAFPNITPKVLDLDYDSWLISSIPRTSLVIDVYNYGNVNLNEYKGITITDACEAWGANPINGDIVCFSFFANKNITSGEGGCLCTDNQDYFETAKHLANQAHYLNYVHDDLGYNYRITNLQAALLFGQLEIHAQIDNIKCEIFEIYDEYFSGLEYLKLQSITPETQRGCWIYPLVSNTIEYNDLYLYFKELGIEIRPFFKSIREHSYLESWVKNLKDKNTLKLSKYGFMLPSYPELSKKQQLTIINKIRTVHDKL